MARVQLLLEKDEILLYNEKSYAGVAELVDAPHSKCGGAIRAGSSPATGTMPPRTIWCPRRLFSKAAPTSFAQLLSKSQAFALSCDLRPQPAAASYNRHSINVNRGQDLEQKMTGFPNFDLILLSIRYSCSKILVSKRRKRRRQALLCRVSAKYSADFSIKTVISNQWIYGTKYSRTAAWRP